MLERTLVQSRGFRNTGPPGNRSGFELMLRLPNYRGMRASLVDGVDVIVDDVLFPYETNYLILQGRELSLAQLREAVDLRWTLEEPAIVRVLKAGGLSVGVHDVAVAVRIRQPYFPIEFQPSIIRESREATIVL